MAYTKKSTGGINTDSEGKVTVYINEIAGELIKVRVLYNKSVAGTETRVKLSTMEGEIIWDLVDNNDDALVYPRIPLHDTKFMHVSWGQDQELSERIVNVGPIKIEVTGANGEGIAIKNIIFTYKE